MVLVGVFQFNNAPKQSFHNSYHNLSLFEHTFMTHALDNTLPRKKKYLFSRSINLACTPKIKKYIKIQYILSNFDSLKMRC